MSRPTRIGAVFLALCLLAGAASSRTLAEDVVATGPGTNPACTLPQFK